MSAGRPAGTALTTAAISPHAAHRKLAARLAGVLAKPARSRHFRSPPISINLDIQRPDRQELPPGICHSCAAAVIHAGREPAGGRTAAVCGTTPDVPSGRPDGPGLRRDIYGQDSAICAIASKRGETPALASCRNSPVLMRMLPPQRIFERQACFWRCRLVKGDLGRRAGPPLMPVGSDHRGWFPVNEQHGHLILVLVGCRDNRAHQRKSHLLHVFASGGQVQFDLRHRVVLLALVTVAVMLTRRGQPLAMTRTLDTAEPRTAQRGRRAWRLDLTPGDATLAWSTARSGEQDQARSGPRARQTAAPLLDRRSLPACLA